MAGDRSGGRERPTRVLDLRSAGGDRVRATRARAGPWAALTRLLGEFMRPLESPRWERRGQLEVVYGSSRAILQVGVRTMFTGDVESAEFRTVTVDPGAADPPDGFEHAVHMTLARPDGGPACEAELHAVSKKPSHGVRSGTDAVGMAIALCRLLGCRAVKLYDGSRLGCPEADAPMSLRKARILSRGSGWYESKGFRSVIETLDPGRFRQHVPKLHSLRLRPLMACLEAQDAALRRAVADAPAAARMTVHVHHHDSSKVDVVSPPALKDIVAIIDSVSVALDILRRVAGPRPGARTLGKVVDDLIARDCKSASQLVDSLLPDTQRFLVLVHGPDGSPVPPLPHLDAWIFTWHVTRAYSDLTLRLT